MRKLHKRHAGGPGSYRTGPQHRKAHSERAAEIAAAKAALLALHRQRAEGVKLAEKT